MSTNKITKRHVEPAVKNFIMQNTGGRPVIERLLKAYGFATRQALCNHLGISQSTMANRYARDTFPSDWTIICSLETGACLQWLVSGDGVMFEEQREQKAMTLKHQNISNGVLSSPSEMIYDSSAIPSDLSSPFLITNENSLYLVDVHTGEINDGWWLIEIDGLVSVREVFRFPGGRVRIENGRASFECQAHDIKVLGKVISRTQSL